MNSINFERDLKSILAPGESSKIVVVIINNGILNVELNTNHEQCCGKKGSSIIHFGPRFCLVNLHKGVDQKEISQCKHCKEILSRSGNVISDDVDKQDSSKKKENDTIEENEDTIKAKEDSVIEEKDSVNKIKDLIKEKKDSINEKIDTIKEKKGMKVKTPLKKKKASFSCDICKKHLKSEYFLKNHVFTAHLKLKNFTCTWCNKAFFTELDLKSHTLIHRDKDNCYICDRCGKKFKWSGQLKYHMQYMHLKKKRFNCPWCRKRFCTRSNLQCHTQMHTPIKPFACGVCGKLFRAYILASRHFFRTHPQV